METCIILLLLAALLLAIILLINEFINTIKMEKEFGNIKNTHFAKTKSAFCESAKWGRNAYKAYLTLIKRFIKWQKAHKTGGFV